jgi:Xaa-Pro aminopeptidase
VTTLTLAVEQLETLRVGRLARLQAAMRLYDAEACLLFNEPNVRYATNASAMPVYAMSTFARCAVVAQEGTPILFEHPNSVHRSRLRAPDVRQMHAWEFFDDPGAEAAIWAEETVSALRELGVTGDRVALDRLGTPGYLALAALGISVQDSAPVTQEARRVKTPEEQALFDLNASLVAEMIGTVEAAIAPGVSERELLAVMANVMILGGGEYLATHTLCSGPNTNPWRAGGHRPADRTGGPRVRRHRRRRHRGLFLLRVADVRRGRAHVGAARDVHGRPGVDHGHGGAGTPRHHVRRVGRASARHPGAVRRPAL